MANQVVWCDIPCLNLDRAILFYSSILATSVRKEEFPGMTLGVLPHGDTDVGGCLYQTESDKPADHGPLLYFNCNGRLDEAVAGVEAYGGKVLKPKHSLGPHGWRAIVLDSEGNRIALHAESGDLP